MNFDYEEPDVMTEKGPLYGIYLHHRFKFSTYWHLETDADFSAGELDYEGGTFDPVTGETEPATAPTEDLLFNIRALALSPTTQRLQFAIGLGYRQWRNEILAPGGYRRHTTYFFLPIGLQWRTSLKETHFTFQLFYNQWIQGRNTSYLSDVNPDVYDDYQFDQNDGRGFSLNAHSQIPLSAHWADLGVSLFYRYWSVENSTAVPNPVGSGFLLEPENNTQVAGLRIGFIL